jgi:hypothetical protein
MRARQRFLLPHKKYMIENGFEGIGLVLVVSPSASDSLARGSVQ